MTRWLSTTVALTAALALGACANAPQTNAAADLAGVNSLRTAFAAAYDAGDAEAFVNLFTTDAISQANHQATVTGRDAIVENNRGMFSQFSAHMELMADETKTMGDFGFDRGRYKLTLAPKSGGAPIVDEGRYTVLLQKGEDGAWRVSRDIDNSAAPLPTPSPAPDTTATK